MKEFTKIDSYKAFNAPNKGVNSLPQISPKEAFESNSFLLQVKIYHLLQKKKYI